MTQSSLADLLRTRGQYDEAERLYRESLRVFEAVGDSRSVAVTQSSLADLLSTRGQYDEAERLYRAGLATCQQILDRQGIAVFQMRLGNLALRRGRPQDALPLLDAARAGFTAIGLTNWLPGVEALQARARGETFTLDDLLGLVWAARHGDRAAGERAAVICTDMLTMPDWEALARILQRVLAGEEPAAALAAAPELSEADRTYLLTALLAE